MSTVVELLRYPLKVPVAGFGRAACFGTYAEVVQPGRIRLGQRFG